MVGVGVCHGNWCVTVKKFRPEVVKVTNNRYYALMDEVEAEAYEDWQDWKMLNAEDEYGDDVDDDDDGRCPVCERWTCSRYCA